MTWMEIAWTMMAAASLTLGFVHLMIWLRQRSQYIYLVFFVMALSIALYSVFELSAARAQTPAQYIFAARWAQLPLLLFVLSLLLFVRLYLQAGRTWLAATIAALRVLVTVLGFGSNATVHFRAVTGLAHVASWKGVVISTPLGVLTPWASLPAFVNLLVAIFVADAALTLWRRGDSIARRRALLVGGAVLLCVLFASASGVLVIFGLMQLPILLTPCFLLVLLAVGYELGWDVLHAAQVSRELHDSEQRIDLAARAADLVFWSWNAAHDEVWITAKGRSLFGLGESGHVNLDTLLARVHAEDRTRVRDAVHETILGSGSFEQEFRLASPGKELRWLAARGQVGVGPSNSALLRGVALDVTARWRLESELAQQRGELAHLSRVSTLGELSGSLAHEINQPLMASMSNAQAAQRFLAAGSLEDVRECLTDIVEADTRAGEVIRRLRALLKKGEVQRVPLEVGYVVDDVLRLLRNELINRGIAATIELPPALPVVLGDRVQLQQVLLNLAVNACDAMHESDARELLIRAERIDGAAVEIALSDSGVGIAPTDLERIFEPFVTTKAHGMGLGLSVCRTIITAHGGRLWAENNGQRGATFRFTLPVAGTH